ncbi:hypothetical protein Trco_007685 [Trichoderma cornu-damae]|uniref:Protein PBN1 n=1 Tax=Trichoderma cornu-damae TaxID=654480 RepID=A0A9P8TUJ8_9HYPO|nr:hypothetical protein Trco_007685 [Trichoderma cornu-damae]
MRERITYFHPLGAGIDPGLLEMQDAKVRGPAVEAVREHKMTLTLPELPSELAGLLRDLEELHVRWAASASYNTLEPFISRLSPGLHVSYTPLKEGQDPEKLCTALQAFGRLDCASPESYINFSDGRQAGSPALFFYHQVEKLDGFAKRLVPVACSGPSAGECRTQLQELRDAVSLDVSYDAASGSVKIQALWPLRKREISVAASPKGRTEVGILGRDAPPGMEAHEIGVSGVLAVVGEQKEPSPALFSFAARHRTASGSFTSEFQKPTGLHPTLRLSLSTAAPPLGGDDGDAGCAPYAYLTLPKVIFADRYQLADDLFLASKNLTATKYVSEPVDLEAPAYATKPWGSNVLLQLAPPKDGAAAKDWAVEVPLHLRYLKPTPTGKEEVEIPYPVVFWACDGDEDAGYAVSPFDRVNLGYDGLFRPSTTFWHVSPEPEAGGRLVNSINVPVVAEGASRWVGIGTAVAVGLGFLWILLQLVGGHASKLEELEQELRTIQQVVNTKKANSESAWSPPSPLTAFSASSEQAPSSAVQKPARPPLALQLVAPPSRPPQKRQKKAGPTEARVLGSVVISGQDVDYYFSKKEPDECFDAQPMLFWAILYVACRRYAKDDQLFGALVEHMSKNLWTMMSSSVLGLDEIHAILLVCAWPYPTIRYVTDPSSMFATIAMNACLSLGLHTGRGSHPQFCVGSRHSYTSTDEEASSTWLACCFLAQRTSATAGLPPPFLQHSDARCKAALESNYWADLLSIYELQRFVNRFHMAMLAQTSTVGSVPDSAVAVWENEFETLKSLIVRCDTEVSRIFRLAAQLEVQLFYFMSPSTITATNNSLSINVVTTTTAAAATTDLPSSSPPSPSPPPSSNPTLHLNTLKTFATARSLILTALDLDSRSRFISHCPAVLGRVLTDAANTVVYLLHSHWGPGPDAFSPEEANLLAQQASSAVMRCSAKEQDIWHRSSVIMETFWSYRNYVPKFDTVPPSWVSRGGAGVTYACLQRFKNGLLTAQNSTDGVNKCLEIIQFRTDQSTGSNTVAQDQLVTSNVPASDPFQDVDWSTFMDDFGWAAEDGVLMSLI